MSWRVLFVFMAVAAVRAVRDMRLGTLEATEDESEGGEVSFKHAASGARPQGTSPSCDTESAGYDLILKRDGSHYELGAPPVSGPEREEWTDTCTGTYSHVVANCRNEAQRIISDSERQYSRSAVGMSPTGNDWTALPPWHPTLTVNVQLSVYRSESVSAHIDRIMRHDVNGIGQVGMADGHFSFAENTTFDELFRELEAAGCKAVIWGGEVRDAMLGIDSMDTDIGYFCLERPTLVEVLRTHGWGGTFKTQDDCEEEYEYESEGPGDGEQALDLQGRPVDIVCKHRNSYNTYVQVGHPKVSDEGLEGKNAYDNILSKASQIEFTTNALAFDPVDHLLLDTTGTGLCDTLGRRIAFPRLECAVMGPECYVSKLFNDWADIGNGKMTRFLKLLIPPKSYCMDQLTFHMIMSTYASTEERFNQFAHSLIHMITAYKRRGPQMLLYAREALVLHCQLESLNEIWTPFTVALCALDTDWSEPRLRQHIESVLEDHSVPMFGETWRLERYGGEPPQWIHDISQRLLCTGRGRLRYRG